ncbi:MAG TPA: TIGR00725 family protein [Pyrinomonadaceae bacterium]|nr:TIGR00725 family protein [Pyrinomonadaceae bacterium]
MSKIVVGVLGPGEGASDEAVRAAFELGQLIAVENWVLLTGGRGAGVMEAASRGAKAASGLTIGILPSEDARGASEFVDIPILTGMGQARNNINVLSARLLFACGMGAGTASEIALAIKAKKRVILLCANQESEKFFKALGKENVFMADSPCAAIEAARKFLTEQE